MILSLSQITVSIILIALILLQERSAGMSGFFGGDGSVGPYQTRRGIEKFVFRGTIILVVAFIALAILHLVA